MDSPGRRSSLWLALGLGLVLLGGWWAASRWYADQRTARKRADVDVELSSRSAALQTAIGQRFALLDGMVGLVESQPSQAALDATFAPFAASLLASGSSAGIRNFALFPDGQQRYEYPAANNEVPEAFRNLYTHPVQDNRESVARTLETRHVALGTPRQLGQGGLGLVATQAVYAQGQLWGFVTMALDVPPILSQAGLDSDDPHTPVQMALSDGSGNVFFGSARLLGEEAESVGVPLPEGGWRLYGAPRGGWSGMDMDDLRLVQGTSLAAVLLVTLVALLMLSRQERLVFEKQRLETLEASERAALAQAERSRQDAELARNEAEQALVTRDLFLRTLAHDLKTPLASMAWQIQVLLRRTRGGKLETAQIEHGLASIANQTADAVTAIDELHDLTRAAAGAPLQLDCEPLDLAEQVRRVVASLPPSPGSEVRCEVEASGVIVNADRARLGRMLRNLIDNAIKYSPDGGVVVITVGRTQSEDGRKWAEMHVRDQGLGIPVTDQPHVFERYRRGANVAHIEGEGLGLASVRHLAELHAGEVQVESEEGVGSTFTLRLPLLD